MAHDARDEDCCERVGIRADIVPDASPESGASPAVPQRKGRSRRRASSCPAGACCCTTTGDERGAGTKWNIDSGELTLRRKNRAATGREVLETNLELGTGAVGLRGWLLDGNAPSRIGLNLRSGALRVSTGTDRVQELESAEGEGSRLRLILLGERPFAMEAGRRFIPEAELGVRVESADAKTGTGLDKGVGIRFSWGSFGLEGEVRGLEADEEPGYEKRGASTAVRVSPSTCGHELTASLEPIRGYAGSQPLT